MTRNLRGLRARAVTLEDVAQRAGVAASTASYVLNNKPKSIGAATRERVLEAAREIGYRPNTAARSLVTRRTNIVALWVPSVSTAFAARVIAEIQGQARHREYEVLICDALLSEQGEADAPTATLRMPGPDVDGIIAFFGSSSRRARLGSHEGRGVPTVSMGAFSIEGTDFVGLNLGGAAQDAVRWLLSSGRQRVAFLVPASADFPGDERREAYASVMKEAGREAIVIRADHNSRASAREAVHKYLQDNPAPDGLFCYNDYAAIGASRALRESGLSIPGDVLLVGCDGIEDIEYLGWPLSTIDLPIREMCRTAWQFLEQRLQDHALPPQRAMLAARLRTCP